MKDFSEGLPPVGWDGEYTKPSGFIGRKCVWRWCVVVAHDRGGALVRTNAGHYQLLTVNDYSFRPIMSKDERDQADLANFLNDYVIPSDFNGGLSTCEDYAEKILATFNLTRREAA